MDVLQASTNSGSRGINVLNRDLSGTGVYSWVPGLLVPGPGVYTAGYFHASGKKLNYAVYGVSDGASGGSATVNYGGWFQANNGASNIALYAKAPLSSGNFALRTDGDIFINSGFSSITGIVSGSDSVFKTNVQNIGNAMEVIQQLKPKSFYYDTNNTYGLNFPSKKQYGFIAQQVNPVLPELVYSTTKPDDLDSAGNVINPAFTYSSLNYNAFIGLLTAGMQQQQEQLDKLQDGSGGIRDTLRTGFIAVVSDANFKTNIDSINNASATISQLKPRSFYFDTANAMSTYNLKLNNQKQYGLIAQDVQTVLPELVGNTHRPAQYDANGNQIAPAVDFKNLNYNAFIALLIKSNQELQQRISALENTVSTCCSSNSRTINTNSKNNIDVELADADVIVLNQNQPNPFAEQTTITFNIPQSTGFAQMLFYDVNGRQIKAVDIIKKGKGQLTVFANDLSNGIYSYTLIVDGKIFETKKMIKQQ